MTFRVTISPPPSVNLYWCSPCKSTDHLYHLTFCILAYIQSSPLSSVCRGRFENLTWPYSTSASTFAVCSIQFPCCFMTLTSASVTFWSSSSFAIRHNNQVWQKRRMIVLIRFLDKNLKKKKFTFKSFRW